MKDKFCTCLSGDHAHSFETIKYINNLYIQNKRVLHVFGGGALWEKCRKTDDWIQTK